MTGGLFLLIIISMREKKKKIFGYSAPRVVIGKKFKTLFLSRKKRGYPEDVEDELLARRFKR